MLILFLFVSSLLKRMFIIFEKSDQLGFQEMIPAFIGFVFGSNSSKKAFSISGGKKS